MVKAYYYGKGEVVTLYDKLRGDSLYGTLTFTTPTLSKNIDSTPRLALLNAYAASFKQQIRPIAGYFTFPVLPQPQRLKFNLSRFLTLPRAQLIKLNTTKILALILLIVSLAGISFNVIPLIAGEINLRVRSKNAIIVPKNTPNPVVIPSTTPIADTEVIIDEFNVIIPKLNLESTAIVNVDPSNPLEYNRVLAREGIAHAKGSYLPGQSGGPVVLFAHSTDTVENILQFNAKFFGLKDMEAGDEIILTVGEKVYHYKITAKKIVEPSDISSIQSTEDDLVLSTCWPPGTNWQRLLVFAKRAN